jgi:hypothetical protein
MIDAIRSQSRKGLLRALLLLQVLAFIAMPTRPARSQPAAEPQAFRLIGVVEGGKFTGAVLIDSTGEQTFYRLREELPDGSRITKVESDSIRLKRSDGSSYELFIIHDSKPSAPSARSQGVPPASPPPAPAQPLSGPEKRVSAAGGNRQARTPKTERRSETRGSTADR